MIDTICENESKEQMSLESLLQSLSSCSTDASSPRTRKSIEKCALSFLPVTDEEGKIIMIATSCFSPHSQKRLVCFFTNALLTTDKPLGYICTALCKVLVRSIHPSHLMHWCLLQLKTRANHALSQAIVDALTPIWKDSDGSTPDWFAALSISVQLRSKIDALDVKIHSEMLSIVMKLSLGNKAGSFKANHFLILQPFLHSLSQSQIDTILAPTIAIKLRANPESVIESVKYIIENLSNFNIELATSLLETSDAKLFSTTIKQIRSTNEHIRRTAVDIFVHIAKISGSDGIIQYLSANAVVANLVDAFAAKPKNLPIALSLNQPVFRGAAYEILGRVGLDLSINVESINRLSVQTHISNIPWLSTTDSLLSILVSVLVKEPAGDVLSLGNQALMVWVWIAKAICNKNSLTVPLSGYNAAMDYFAKPILSGGNTQQVTGTSNNLGFEFRSVGSFILFIEVQKARGHDDLLDSLIIDLVNRNTKQYLNGLQIMIESAIKKFTINKSVPQIDGLIALFVDVIYNTACYNQNDSLGKLASSTVKLVKNACVETFDSDKISFLFAKVMLDAAITDSLVGCLLHMTLARLLSGTSYIHDLLNFSAEGSVSAAAYAMATCICMHQPKFATLAATVIPTSISYRILDNSISVICSSSQNAEILLSAIFTYINIVTYRFEKAFTSLTKQEARNLRENIDLFSGKDQTFPINSSNVQRVARMLLRSHADMNDPVSLGKGLILLHAGATTRPVARQRSTLRTVTGNIILQLSNGTTSDTRVSSLVNALVNCSSFDPRDTETTEHNESIQSCRIYSSYIFRASLSLISTLGTMAGDYKSRLQDSDVCTVSFTGYDTAWQLCMAYIAPRLSGRFLDSLRAIEILTSSEIDLYLGICHETGLKIPHETNEGTKINPYRFLNEDEKWDQAVRRELEEKKTISMPIQGIGSDDESKIIERRKKAKISKLLEDDFTRSLLSFEFLLQSDIELGNELLQIFSKPVLWAVLSPSYAFKAISTIGPIAIRVLRLLAECVYEIDENQTNNLLHALRCSCKRPNLELSDIIYNPLPSSCYPVSETLFQIREQTLSPGSFTFMFPIIRAALTGPRTSNGCECALLILQRHTKLLNVDERFRSLRKDMVSTVLELLTHDRCQIFTDPSPYQVLESIYLPEAISAVALSSSDLSPLFGNIGALGMKHSRIGVMVVLKSIVTRFPELAKNNALLENRIWINCFSGEDEIKAAARAAWEAAYGAEGSSDNVLSPPSKLITAALLPILASIDQSVARAAAFAYAHAISHHRDIMEKNIIRLLNAYIDAYPTPTPDLDSSSKHHEQGSVTVHEVSRPHISSTQAKKNVKKPVSTAASSVMAALATTKKKSTSGSIATSKTTLNNILKPKERTVDREMLEAQLKVSVIVDAPVSEKDDNTKVLTRKGVIRVIASLAAPSCNVQLSDQVIQLLIGFLIGFGLADRNDDTYCDARDTLRDLVARCGSSQESQVWLFPVLEEVLSNGAANFELVKTLDCQKIPRDVHTLDKRKEGVVVAVGSAATHLNDDTDANKIAATVDMLLKTLSTPSESVQSSVALCLTNLMKKGQTHNRIENLLTTLLKTCFGGSSLAQRRGAAYGIAAIVKGSGIASLKKFEVIKQLEEACNDGAPNAKEGALFAIELLSRYLGLLFEPYVIILLPTLLHSFSDNSVHVRSAAQATVATIMNKLSGHGVKLILPSVLAGLQSEEWRAAVASISLLGSMSNLAPKQLAT